MKYFFMLIFIVGIFSECQHSQKIPSFRKQYKEIYIDQFKLTYLRRLLIKGYNNSAAIQEIINFDRSGFTEPILLEEDLKLIDSLTNIDNQNMMIDSAEGIHRAEGSQGKRPLGFTFGKLQSKWLDSLARKRYKRSGLAKQEF